MLLKPAVANELEPISSEEARAAGAHFDGLHQQLQEKEQLIIALTDRLEQAAEQLDRLRRTGVDRGGRRVGGGGSLPPELVEDHRAVVEDLKQVIARWEDMQASAALGRLETQVSELRDLVAGYVVGGPGHGAPPRGGDEAVHRSASAAQPAHSTPLTWWEAQKAAMLGDGPVPGAADHGAAGHDPAAPFDTPGAGETPFDLQAASLPDLPPTVDFESLSLDGARQAIRDRDQLINELREPLLLLQAAGSLPPDLKLLGEVPEDVRQRIDALEAAWQAKFRQAEMDLSLERARLARAEAAVVRQNQDQHRDESDATAEKDKAGRKKGEPADDGNQRRWFRFLGGSKEGTGGSQEGTGGGE